MKSLSIFAVLFIFINGCSITNQTTKEERYCIVVEEVKKTKKGAIVRPKSQIVEVKKIKHWYRYPSPNVFPGDTIDVSSKQLITGPTF